MSRQYVKLNPFSHRRALGVARTVGLHRHYYTLLLPEMLMTVLVVILLIL